jgi:hypothetical protein
MNWKRVPKEKSNQPAKGTYSDWKVDLSKEGFHQCVYCTITEHSFGGIRNFHVEHFKPKSVFPELENTFTNLFFACSICNCFKSNDWYDNSSSDFNTPFYPDPSKIDYSEIFEVIYDTGKISGKNITSKYLENKLYLNRPQLTFLRREYYYDNILKDTLEKLEHLKIPLKEQAKLNNQEALNLYFELEDIESRILKLSIEFKNTLPYKQVEIQR